MTGHLAFGELLRGHRHAARLTLEQLAQLSGVSARTLSDMELARAGSLPGAGVVGLITSSGGMGKTTLAVRAAHLLRPGFPDGVLFVDLLGMSPQPMAADDALRRLLRALGVADNQVPGDIHGRASLYRSLLRDRRVLVVLDNAGSEEQVRPLLPGEGTGRALITARRLLAGLEGVRRLALKSLALPEATELPILPPRTGSCSWTGASSRPPSPPMCPRSWRRSWLTLRSGSALTR